MPCKHHLQRLGSHLMFETLVLLTLPQMTFKLQLRSNIIHENALDQTLISYHTQGHLAN